MSSLPWGLCTVTAARLTWVLLHSISLMTPPRAAQPLESRERGQNSLWFPSNHCSVGQQLSFQSRLHPLYFTGLNASVPRFLSLPNPGNQIEVFQYSWSRALDGKSFPFWPKRMQNVIAPLSGSWDLGPTEDQAEA